MVHAAEPHLTAVQTIMGVIFLVSFAHQPLTLGWCTAILCNGPPIVGCIAGPRSSPFALIVIGLNVSLSAVALMAGLWNAEHTLMQRYGVMRIYGRKAGDDHGHIEKPMLIIWLVAGISYIGGYVDLEQLVRKLGLGGTNARRAGARDPLRSPGPGAVLGRCGGQCRACGALVAGRAFAGRCRCQPGQALLARWARLDWSWP